jgi:hypothetical protein
MSQPDSEPRAIMAIETPSDMDFIRRRSIVANHRRPDDPVFNPEDYE